MVTNLNKGFEGGPFWRLLLGGISVVGYPIRLQNHICGWFSELARRWTHQAERRPGLGSSCSGTVKVSINHGHLHGDRVIVLQLLTQMWRTQSSNQCADVTQEQTAVTHINCEDVTYDLCDSISMSRKTALQKMSAAIVCKDCAGE